MKLTRNKVLVTGATSGIGLAMTKRWLALGNEVLAVDRNHDGLATLAAEYEGLHPYTCDLGNEAALLDLAQHIRSEHPNLNILVNNTGIHFNPSLGQEKISTTDQISNEIDVNLRATILLTEQLMPVLKARPSAAVVNVSSGLSVAPKRSTAVYNATKAGVHVFSKALRNELADSTVKVFEIISPLVDTWVNAGRDQDKMPVEDLVSEFMYNFRKDREDVTGEKFNLLRTILRAWPDMGYRRQKNA